MIRKPYRTHPWVSFDHAKNLEHHVYKVEFSKTSHLKFFSLQSLLVGTNPRWLRLRSVSALSSVLVVAECEPRTPRRKLVKA